MNIEEAMNRLFLFRPSFQGIKNDLARQRAVLGHFREMTSRAGKIR